MRPICLDFDDYCDATAPELAKLDELKVKCPNLVVTLFTIPKRTSQAAIDEARSRDWIHLAPHGWRHTRGECLSWTQYEASDKINLAASMGIDTPIFKAPAWLIDGEVYKACADLSYSIASHTTFRLKHTRVPEYIYNLRIPGHKWYGAVHGHLTNTPAVTNYIDNMLNRGELNFHADTKFLTCTELAKVVD